MSEYLRQTKPKPINRLVLNEEKVLFISITLCLTSDFEFVAVWLLICNNGLNRYKRINLKNTFIKLYGNMDILRDKCIRYVNRGICRNDSK